MISMSEYKNDREALKDGSTVELTPFDLDSDSEHSSASLKSLEIISVLGTGTTAVAYRAFDLHHQVEYVLKECYPQNAGLIRDGQMLIVEGSSERFDKAKERFREGYRLSRELYLDRDIPLDMSTSAPVGFYSGNGTLYSAYMIRQGMTYDKRSINSKPYDGSLGELLFVIYSLADTISSYHNRGYLYLDIRDDNIMVLGCTGNSDSVKGVMLFDFDSMTEIGDVAKRVISRELRFSGANKPSELKEPVSAKDIGIRTDQYQIAALMYQRLSGGEQFSRKIQLKRSGLLAGVSDFFYCSLTAFLERALVQRSYSDDDQFLSDLKELMETAYAQEHPGLDVDHCIDFRLLRESSKRSFVEASETKFKALDAINHIYANHVSPLLVENGTAKEAMPLDVMNGNRLLFLAGDGGSGKSTLLHSYMKSKINDYSQLSCFYMELYNYDGKENGLLKPVKGHRCSDWIPMRLLSMINSLDFIPDEDTAEFGSLKNQYVGLDRMLSQTYKDGFRFALLLDGFNEVDDYLKSSLLDEIECYAKRWKGVQFVVTGRKVPDELGKNVSGEPFAVYDLLGLNQDEISETLNDSSLSDEFKAEVMNDQKLLDVLRIPLFMNMFLWIDSSNIRGIRTRGEILDVFVSSRNREFYTESVTAEHAPSNEERLFRQFLMDYLLPFAASRYDRERAFSMDKIKILDSMLNGKRLLLENNSISIPAADQRYTDMNISAIKRKLSQMVNRSPLHDQNGENEELSSDVMTVLTETTVYMVCDSGSCYKFTHQYFKDYFAAKHIQNVLILAKSMQAHDPDGTMQLAFVHDLCGLDYVWSDDVCMLLGEILGDYKNDPLFA